MTSKKAFVRLEAKVANLVGQKLMMWKQAVAVVSFATLGSGSGEGFAVCYHHKLTAAWHIVLLWLL